MMSSSSVSRMSRRGDEAADIEDVDMGEDAAPLEEDDTFLEEEEEEGNVSGILGGGKGGDEEDT